MNDETTIVGIFNDLITVNKNRITGYKQAIHVDIEKEAGTTELFDEMIRQSEHNIKELGEIISNAGAKIQDKTSTSGNIV